MNRVWIYARLIPFAALLYAYGFIIDTYLPNLPRGYKGGIRMLLISGLALATLSPLLYWLRRKRASKGNKK